MQSQQTKKYQKIGFLRNHSNDIIRNFAVDRYSETMFAYKLTYILSSTPKVTIWGDEHPFAQII